MASAHGSMVAMWIQFTASVSVPGGPRYHAGEVVETDAFHLTERVAAGLIRRGWAVAVAPRPAPASPPPIPMKAPDRPPADKMLRGPAVKK